MKVHELIAELEKLPPDFEVVMAGDTAYEFYDRVFDHSLGWYDEGERDFTSLILEIDIPDERLHRDRKRSECNAICLWP